ncbi:MAG: hypothetical protein ABI042_10485 [Verrucomicrobiota bacterium]
MTRKIHLFLGWAVVVSALAILTGCATTDPENVSSRPWNSPQGWTALPSGINEGR